MNPHSWVFWVFAGTKDKFEQGFKEIATTLKLPGASDPNVDALALVTHWLNKDRPRNSWLLILDNLDDIDLFYQSKASVDVQKIAHHGRTSSDSKAVNIRCQLLSEYLPKISRGTILVTTRVKATARRMVGENDLVIDVPLMSEEEASQLLQVKLPSDLKGKELAAGIELVNELDRLPLAVTQASAYIGNNDITVSGYLEMFKDQANQADLLEDGQNGDTRREKHGSNAVSTTWRISFDQIANREGVSGQEAIKLLHTMCFFDRTEIPGWLLSENPNLKKFRDAIGKLTGYSLIVAEKEKSSYGMHRLVQLVTRSRVEKDGEIDEWKFAALKLVAKRFPSGESETWKLCDEIMPHFQVVKEYKLSQQSEEIRALILSKKAHYDFRKGMIRSMRIGLEEELDIRLKLEKFGLKHPSTLAAMHKLASAHGLLGNDKVAGEMMRSVWESRKQLLGAEHIDTLESLGDLAVITKDENRSAQALECYSRILGEHKHTAESLHNHSVILTFKGNTGLALEFNEKAIAMMQKLHLPEHPEILLSQMERSKLLFEMRRYEEGEKIAREVLHIREAVLGASHTDTLLSLVICAYACWLKGDYVSAEEYAIRCHEERSKHPEMGPNHIDTLNILSSVGHYQRAQDKFEVAQRSYEAALSKMAEALGPAHDETWLCRLDLGLLLLQIGNTKEALEILQSFIIMVKANGVQNLKLLDITIEIASRLTKVKQWEAAETLLKAISDAVCEEPELLQSAIRIRATDTLGYVYQKMKKFNDAEKLFRAEYDFRTNIHGPAAVNTLRVCRALIEVLTQQGKFDEAKDTREKESTLFITPESRLEKQKTLQLLAQEFAKDGRNNEAEKVHLELKSFKKKEINKIISEKVIL